MTSHDSQSTNSIAKNSSIESNTTQSEEDNVHNYTLRKTGKDLEKYIDDIAETVRISLDQSISILTPWFFSNMPSIYYQTTPKAEKVRHLSAIITGHIFEAKQTVELWDKGHEKVTYIGPGGDQTQLANLIGRLSTHSPKMGSLYFSHDHLLFISTFFCDIGKKADLSNKHIVQKINHARGIIKKDYPLEEENINLYFETLSNEFVKYATDKRLHYTFKMLNHMLHHEGAHTFFDDVEGAPQKRLFLGIKGVSMSIRKTKHFLDLLDSHDFYLFCDFLCCS
jgi:glutamate dehydrogenase